MIIFIFVILENNSLLPLGNVFSMKKKTEMEKNSFFLVILPFFSRRIIRKIDNLGDKFTARDARMDPFGRDCRDYWQRQPMY